jgi:hypothetical protein
MSEIERQRSMTAGSEEYVAAPDTYGDGWVMFSGAMIFFVGLWNAFEGGVAFFRSTWFAGTPVFGTLAFWATVWIVIGVIQIVVAASLISGNNWARWFGVAIVVVSMASNMLGITLYPWWSLFVLAMDLLILYGLLVRWRGAAATG